ncbi:MAG TPA: hypothetical protein VD861_04250 [Pyrinomonadaceae bacterium]|nr:hypothetical protein [Pyrinomonadaceae bacterium]
MYDKLYSFLLETATWPRVLLLVALCFLIAGLFEFRAKELGYGNPGLDSRWRGYSPEEARKFFQDIGEDGRKLYAATELTMDIAFPLVYGSLFSALVILLYGQQRARYLVLAPLLAAAFDLAENVTLAIMASTFKGQASGLARLAVVFTLAKCALLGISLLMTIVGVPLLVVAALRGKRGKT